MEKTTLKSSSANTSANTHVLFSPVPVIHHVQDIASVVKWKESTPKKTNIRTISIPIESLRYDVFVREFEQMSMEEMHSMETSKVYEMIKVRKKYMSKKDLTVLNEYRHAWYVLGPSQRLLPCNAVHWLSCSVSCCIALVGMNYKNGKMKLHLLFDNMNMLISLK